MLFKDEYPRWNPRLLWFNKRIIDIKVLGFEDNKRGGLSADFLLARMIFALEGIHDFVYMLNSQSFPPDDIIRLYEGGKFKKRRWIDGFYEKNKYIIID